MKPFELLKKYAPSDQAFEIIFQHSQKVAQKALFVAKKYQRKKINLQFLEEIALLHDIGVFFTDSKKFGCNGKEPYIRHGYLGGKLLVELGYPKHALAVMRHVGVGITRKEIISQKLPLPKRDFVPASTEEKIVCYADKFFTKKDFNSVKQELKISEIMQSLVKYGREKVEIFQKWHKEFGNLN